MPDANWYPDPTDPTRQRYWDGEGWTHDTRPSGEQPSPAPQAGPDGPADQRRRPPLWLLLAAGAVVVAASLAVLAAALTGDGGPQPDAALAPEDAEGSVPAVDDPPGDPLDPEPPVAQPDPAAAGCPVSDRWADDADAYLTVNDGFLAALDDVGGQDAAAAAAETLLGDWLPGARASVDQALGALGLLDADAVAAVDGVGDYSQTVARLAATGGLLDAVGRRLDDPSAVLEPDMVGRLQADLDGWAGIPGPLRVAVATYCRDLQAPASDPADLTPTDPDPASPAGSSTVPVDRADR